MKPATIFCGSSLASTAFAAFDWSAIPSSTDLTFHRCFDGFECARLAVPLDWIVPEDGRQATIAVTRLPAAVSRDDAAHAGTIIAQPDGLGASGVAYLHRRHKRLRDLVDIPGKRHYDLLSFDPRGVNNTEPRVQCFQGLAAHMRANELYSAGSVDLSEDRLPILLAAAKSDGKQCQNAHGDVLAYLGTTDTARDMLAIVTKLKEPYDDDDDNNSHNNGHASNNNTSNDDKDNNNIYDDDDADDDVKLELRSLRRERALLPRLNYIGVGYGTVLGQYFASMLPWRVGRMVLDGVVDATEYAHEQRWHDGRLDLDVAWRFFDACFAAGSRCDLYRDGDTTVDDTAMRLGIWLLELDEAPLVVASPQGHRMILRSKDIGLQMIRQLRSFEDAVPFLATFLNDAMTDPAGLYDKYGRSLLAVDPPPDACSQDSVNPRSNLLDTQSAIACSDADDLTGRDITYWMDQLHMPSQSLFGWLGAVKRLPCSGWPMQARRSFKGPFRTPKPLQGGNAPAAPLLFMSNRWDPITPLANARSMRNLHPESGLVVQEATGHCATLAPYGPCVKNIVSRYFDTGEVPPGEATCEAARHAWDKEE